MTFPLYLRVPAWAEGASLAINGNKEFLTGANGRYIRVERAWSDGDVVELTLPMTITYQTWLQNKNSASVNYGPLTLSLQIDEIWEPHDSRDKDFVQDDSHWQDDVDASLWPCYVLKPGSDWNFAINLDNEITVERKSWPADDFPFTPQNVPLVFRTTGVKIPSWGYDSTGMTDLLPTKFAPRDNNPQPITFIPMGAARLRISAFPQYK